MQGKVRVDRVTELGAFYVECDAVHGIEAV